MNKIFDSSAMMRLRNWLANHIEDSLHEEPTAHTVKELIAELSKLPPHARVLAYEGESIGVSVSLGNTYWFIVTPPREEEQ